MLHTGNYVGIAERDVPASMNGYDEKKGARPVVPSPTQNLTDRFISILNAIKDGGLSRCPDWQGLDDDVVAALNAIADRTPEQEAWMNTLVADRPPGVVWVALTAFQKQQTRMEAELAGRKN